MVREARCYRDFTPSPSLSGLCLWFSWHLPDSHTFPSCVKCLDSSPSIRHLWILSEMPFLALSIWGLHVIFTLLLKQLLWSHIWHHLSTSNTDILPCVLLHYPVHSFEKHFCNAQSKTNGIRLNTCHQMSLMNFLCIVSLETVAMSEISLCL